MAQHDYVIANASGATVRADINNMALAISSNNSGSSAPSTTYAYLWWLDTSANVLKLRNSANNAWITMPFSVTASNTVDINGGTIDGTNIGASSAGTGAFTSITGSLASTITTTDNTDTLSLISTDADAGVGPNLRLYRNSGSPADNDVTGVITFTGRNDNSQDVIYARHLSYISDASDGTEDGIFKTQTMVAGTIRDRLNITPTEISINEDSKDLDFRVESDNLTHALFVQGSDGNVGLNVSVPDASLHIASNTPTLLFDESDAGQKYRIGSFGGAFAIYDETDTTYRVMLDGAGNVGIANTNPQTTLDVTGTFAISNSTSSYWKFDRDDSDGRLKISDSSAEKFCIETDGKVGIGTTSPDVLLHLKSTSAHISQKIETTVSTGNAKLFLLGHSVGDSVLCFGDNDDADVGSIFYDHSSNYMSFTTNTAEAMRIDSSGRVKAQCLNGVGGFYLTEGTADAFSINSEGANGNLLFKDIHNSTERMRISASGNLYVGHNNSDNARVAVEANSNGSAMIFRRNTSTYSSSAVVGSITCDSSSTAYNTSSDARLKDVTGSSRGLEVINALNPVAYNWKADGKADEGLIAQEVLDIVPNAVSGSEEEYYQMDYSKLVTYLVAGMKEQQEQIEQLKTEIQTLKGE